MTRIRCIVLTPRYVSCVLLIIVGMKRDILLTGATGFLGGYLLLFLLRHSDCRIYCLARRKNNLDTAERLRDRLSGILRGSGDHDSRFFMDLDREWSRIVVLEGDLRYSRLGLSE